MKPSDKDDSSDVVKKLTVELVSKITNETYDFIKKQMSKDSTNRMDALQNAAINYLHSITEAVCIGYTNKIYQIHYLESVKKNVNLALEKIRSEIETNNLNS